jgi:prefoldin subunit 5
VQVRRDQEAVVAAAAARVAALEHEVAELCRRREQAGESLRRLTQQIGEALDALAGTQQAGEPANFVVDHSPVPL